MTFLVGPFNGSGNRTRRRPESHRVVSAPVEPNFSPHLVRPRTLLAYRRSTPAAQPESEPIGPSQAHVHQVPPFLNLQFSDPILVLDPTRKRHGRYPATFSISMPRFNSITFSRWRFLLIWFWAPSDAVLRYSSSRKSWWLWFFRRRSRLDRLSSTRKKQFFSREIALKLTLPVMGIRWRVSGEEDGELPRQDSDLLTQNRQETREIKLRVDDEVADIGLGLAVGEDDRKRDASFGLHHLCYIPSPARWRQISGDKFVGVLKSDAK